MKQELISIVIPVYNVEKYLEECLESVINQTYEKLEIILVDDGSTDTSAIICEKYAKKDSRIKFLQQNNMGVAKTRKKAILEAKGKYVCFVDSDDWVEHNMIESLLQHMDGNDLVTSGCNCENQYGRFVQRTDAFAPGIYQTEEEIDYIRRNMLCFEEGHTDGLLPYIYNKMYRTSIAKEVAETAKDNICYAEDREFVLRYALRCNSICILGECYYYYCYRSNSAVHSANKEFMHNLNEFYLSLEAEFLKYPQKKDLIHQLEVFMTSRIYWISKFMGFSVETQGIRFIFPFQNQLKGKKVILYGAGVVGDNYYRQIIKQQECDVVLWVDKNWMKYEDGVRSIETPEKILEMKYDKVLISIKDKNEAERVKKFLIGLGVPARKIVWKEPISIVDL